MTNLISGLEKDFKKKEPGKNYGGTKTLPESLEEHEAHCGIAE